MHSHVAKLFFMLDIPAAATRTSFALIQVGKQVLDAGEIWCASAPLTAN